MQRRELLIAGASLLLPSLSWAKKKYRRPLYFYHLHTGETFELRCTSDGCVPRSVLKKANYFFRDFRTEQMINMDQRLWDQLFLLRELVGNSDGVFQVISAYRSPQTNAMLRRRSKGVAKKSLHMQGRAIDIRLTGTHTAYLKSKALQMKKGGVGYYQKSNFVHLDTGRVRHWVG